MTSDGHPLDLLKILPIARCRRLAADALVWAATELSQRAAWQGPRIRSLWDGPLTPRWR